MSTSCALRTPFSCTLRILVGKNSLYILPKVLTLVSRKFPLFSFRAIAAADLSKMSSQESVGESRVSNLAPKPTVNSDADHFGPATEEDMEADLMRVDAMEDKSPLASELDLQWGNYRAQLFQTRLSLPVLNFFPMKT